MTFQTVGEWKFSLKRKKPSAVHLIFMLHVQNAYIIINFIQN